MSYQKDIKVTSLEINTLPLGIFYFYQIIISTLDKEDVTLNNNWVKVRQTVETSSSNIGHTQVYVPKPFILLNATYKISKADSTNVSKGIINYNDILTYLFNDKKKGKSNLFFHPLELLINILSMLTQQKLKENNHGKFFSFNGDTFLNPFPSKLTLSVALLESIISNMDSFNPAMFLTTLYDSVGVLFFQDIPNIDCTAKNYKKMFRELKDSDKINVFNLRTVNAMPVEPNEGVISISDSLDFSKIKKFASYSMGNNGEIVPVTPWTQGANFDNTNIKSHIYKLNSKFYSQSVAVGTEIAYTINSPLFNFYKKAKLSYHLKDNQKGNNPGGGNPGGGNQNKNKSKNINVSDIYKNHTHNKKAEDLFNGEYVIKHILYKMASIKNMLNFLSIDLSFIGKIGHMMCTNIESNNKNIIQKFNYTDMKYEKEGYLNIPSGKYIVTHANIKVMISSELAPTYITSATVFNLDDVKDFLVPPTKEKELEDKLKKIYSKLPKPKKKKKKDIINSNVEYIEVSQEKYQEFEKVDKTILESIIDQCIASDDYVNLFPNGTGGTGGTSGTSGTGGPL